MALWTSFIFRSTHYLGTGKTVRAPSRSTTHAKESRETAEGLDAACAKRGKFRRDFGEETVANVAVGTENLFTGPCGQGGIWGRPIVHLDRVAVGECQRLVLGLGLQGDNPVEAEIVQIVQSARHMIRNIGPNLVHCSDGEWVRLTGTHACGFHIDAPTGKTAE